MYPQLYRSLHATLALWRGRAVVTAVPPRLAPGTCAPPAMPATADGARCRRRRGKTLSAPARNAEPLLGSTEHATCAPCTISDSPRAAAAARLSRLRRFLTLNGSGPKWIAQAGLTPAGLSPRAASAAELATAISG